MRTIGKVVASLVLAGAVLAVGYWWGNSQSRLLKPSSSETSPQGRKILYYRNPMGHPDTSPVPKKDSMGMDYLPVYEGEEPPSDNSVVRISTEKIQKLGVRTEVAALRELARTVRAVATVQADERRLHTVTSKFEGWIQRLYVNTTGQTVKKGEALMEVYSPELITAQHEYLIARKGLQSVEDGSPEARHGMEHLAESALQRLRHWDISEADLQALQQEDKVGRHLILRAAASGVVIQKLATEGERFMPGEVLYQIADLTNVWMLAEVFEQDLAMVRPGQAATIRIEAYPDKLFNGKVTFIYPTINRETRTAKVRIELPNRQGLLKPDMYGSVELTTTRGKDKALTVPDSAVLDTGTRHLVLVDLGEGRFESRAVKLGMQSDGYTEVLEGLTAGETVVVSANFLIDAESSLKGALGGFGHAPGSGPGEQAKPGAAVTTSVAASHRGTGTVEAVDWANATVTIAHDPIASLSWPAMRMDFRVKDPGLLQALKPGEKIDFEIVEQPAGEYVIVRIHSGGGKTASNLGGH